MNPLLKILGLMSGTSLDCLDIALIEVYETRGNFHIKNLEFKTYPYDKKLKQQLLTNINPKTSKLDQLCELNFILGELWVKNIQEFCNEINISMSDIDLIGTHGQTFYYYVENNIASYTLQLGEPAIIALKTGITTVGDFRPFDIAVDGIISEAKEAVASGILAYCAVFGIPNNLPKSTGENSSVVMGKICPGNNYKRVLLRKVRNGLEPFRTNQGFLYGTVPNRSQNEETTETGNLLSQDLDELSPLEIVELMNKADFDVLEAIDNVKSDIALVLTEIIASFENGGKLFYTGAGTSGRLGVLDASECPPTFKTEPELVQGIIAGGEKALTTAIEGAEDSGELGRNDIRSKISEKDILIGISANGKAPYVIEGLDEAKKIGARTALITCNNIEKMAFIDNVIVLNVGPEVLSGSTRLKAGTATKMVLNMFTTGAFAKLGKVYGNYMVDLKVSNKKLKKRAVNIVKALTGTTEEQASLVLEKAEGNVKLALLIQLKNIDISKARPLLEKHKGFLRKALLLP